LKLNISSTRNNYTYVEIDFAIQLVAYLVSF
jgi:hypothetical protein